MQHVRKGLRENGGEVVAGSDLDQGDDETVFEPVDPAVDLHVVLGDNRGSAGGLVGGEGLVDAVRACPLTVALPPVLHHGRLDNVASLADHVELTQHVVAL